eukprot:GHVS01078761.1.p1 GENE.GHVS01078761.1~~GHVS01078761.1.p1  ORF type:complete len:495 (-),score=104.22 GHVS01078761.1:166-1650(-)
MSVGGPSVFLSEFRAEWFLSAVDEQKISSMNQQGDVANRGMLRDVVWREIQKRRRETEEIFEDNLSDQQHSGGSCGVATTTSLLPNKTTTVEPTTSCSGDALSSAFDRKWRAESCWSMLQRQLNDNLTDRTKAQVTFEQQVKITLTGEDVTHAQFWLPWSGELLQLLRGSLCCAGLQLWLTAAVRFAWAQVNRYCCYVLSMVEEMEYDERPGEGEIGEVASGGVLLMEVLAVGEANSFKGVKRKPAGELKHKGVVKTRHSPYWAHGLTYKHISYVIADLLLVVASAPTAASLPSALSPTARAAADAALQSMRLAIAKTHTFMESYMVGCVCRDATTNLAAMRAIPAMYRMTARRPPSRPCPYVEHLVAPLVDLRNFSKTVVAEMLVSDWMRRAVDKLSKEYSAEMRTLVDTAHQQETSLQRLQKRPHTSTGTTRVDSSSALSDMQKILMQIRIDVESFAGLCESQVIVSPHDAPQLQLLLSDLASAQQPLPTSE